MQGNSLEGSIMHYESNYYAIFTQNLIEDNIRMLY